METKAIKTVVLLRGNLVGTAHQLPLKLWSIGELLWKPAS